MDAVSAILPSICWCINLSKNYQLINSIYHIEMSRQIVPEDINCYPIYQRHSSTNRHRQVSINLRLLSLVPNAVNWGTNIMDKLLK